MRYLLVFFLIIGNFFNAQESPIQWKKDVKDLGNGLYEVKVIADLQSGWHLYSTENTNEFIIPTVVNFQNSANVEWQGAMKTTGDKETIYSEAFSDDLIEYVGDVTFSRKFKSKTEKPFNIVTEIEYQICNDKTCLAPENIEIDVPVTPKKLKAAEPTATPTDVKNDEEKAPEQKKPVEVTRAENIDTAKAEAIVGTAATTAAINAGANDFTKGSKDNLIIPSIDVDNPLYKDCGDPKEADKSLWLLFGLGFIGGLLALLTPCVYPMIPLTVSYFTKSTGEHTGKGNALMYAFFIFLIFVLISLPFHLFNINSDIFNQISTSVGVNLFFFFVFVFFAFSFFGYYDLTLPQSWLNKSEKLSSAGGLLGVFFMALTLVIVSFSCTGPILGGLLGSISGADGPNKLTAAFAGFGLSWALIFGALALFPQLLKSMPKSGGWLNTTKVVLGFIELALALKFLSKADLVSQTFWLKREMFVMIWMAISICTILYMLGFIRFPHDERPNKITWGKRITALVFLAFTLYLVPGLFPNHNKPNLNILSGLTPPLSVSYYSDSECPLGLTCTNDYYEALQLAKESNKPVFIDFTGWGCENCRDMEQNVWSDPEVFKILNEEVIIVSLYVDEKQPLDNPFTIDLPNGTRRNIKTVGDQWSVFEKENFHEQTQPFYVLITPDQKVINYPVGGLIAKDKFLNFLQCGVSSYQDYQSKN